jgi:Domain of unknown function (DUF5666)
MGQLGTILLTVLTLSTSTAIAEVSFRVPNVDGYVTRVASAQDFDVNGLRVLTSPKTHTVVNNPTVPRANVPFKPCFGQSAKIFGKLDKKHHTITATEIRFDIPAEDTVSGFAIIDLIPRQDHFKPQQLLVRADGYLILISPDTTFQSNLPDQSLAAIHTNVWITYHGHRQPDGTIRADKASFTDNKIIPREDKLLAKTNYDPEKIDSDVHQSGVSKAFLGQDPKKMPPYKDAAMQARIDRIGASLIPAYQKALPESDLTKIIFRFELVDQKKWHDARTMPSGIILVPYQIVDRLKDDSQLATVLADNIACALEKQDFRQQPTNQKLTALNLAGLAGGFFVPGLGLATGIGTTGTGVAMLHRAEQQSGRVSLSLLSDAGYDIQQAPLAWWMLESNNTIDPADNSIPYRAAYLYQTIAATTDHTPPAP